jgi:hypothetical protein
VEGTGVVAVLATAAIIAVVIIALLLRPLVQHRLSANTGIDQWPHTARTLLWRDRGTLFWVNSSGRAAPSRLARPAVKRGEAALAMTERWLAKRAKLRRLWQVLGILWTTVALTEIWSLSTGHRGDETVLVTAAFWLFAMFVNIGPLQTWQARLIQRSIERNRAQLSGDS